MTVPPLPDSIGRRLFQAVELGHPPDAGERPCLGMTCPLVPQELPHAMGLHPHRLLPSPEPPVASQGVLQTFCCSWVQALMDQGMAGRFRGLWGLTVPCNTCDSLQNLPDIWRRSVGPRGPDRLFALRLPVLRDGVPARAVLEAELAAWQAWLEAELGTPLDPDELRRTVDLFNALRGSLRQMQALVAAGTLPYSDLHAAAMAAQVLDRRWLKETLETWLADVEAADAPTPDDLSARLVLVGGPLDHPDLIALVRRSGGVVVGGDTCAVEHFVEQEADLDPADPVADMARRHLRRTPCPVRVGSAEPRLKEVLSLVRRHRADGVLLLPHKGCEPHAFDNVILAEGLHNAGVRHLTAEVEPHIGGHGQLETRLEAFVEMFDDFGEDA